MDDQVRAAYENVGSAVQDLLELIHNDGDGPRGLMTAWVVATTSARYDDNGMRESHTEYLHQLDADLPTCLGLYEFGANYCRRVADRAAYDD